MNYENKFALRFVRIDSQRHHLLTECPTAAECEAAIPAWREKIKSECAEAWMHSEIDSSHFYVKEANQLD